MEKEGRYAAYVDEQPFEHHEILDEGFRQRIMHLSGRQLCAVLPELTDAYFKAVTQDYRRAVKEAIVDGGFKHPKQAAKLAAQHVERVKASNPVPLQVRILLSVGQWWPTRI